MRFVSFLNVSNLDNIQCDSGYIFQSIIAEQLCSMGHEFLMVGPIALDVPGTKHIGYDLGRNKYQVRFDFSWAMLRQHLESLQPDFVLVNQLELGANFRSLITSLQLNIRILSYAHYIPFCMDPLGKLEVDPSLDNGQMWQPIVLNFLSGLVASDLIFVHSRYARQLLLTALKSFNIKGSADKIVILPPPRDPRLVESNKVWRGLGTIVYNHRLYSHYGTDFLVGLLEDLVKELDIKVQVMDILGSRSSERRRLDPSVDDYRAHIAGLESFELRSDGNNRQSYKKILSDCEIGLAPYRKGCIWSMACVDCMSMSIPVVAPKFGCFPDLLPKELCYETSAQAKSIVRQLISDASFWRDMSDIVHSETSNLLPDSAARKLLEAASYVV